MAVAFPIAAGVTLAITGAVGGFLNTGAVLSRWPPAPSWLWRRPFSPPPAAAALAHKRRRPGQERRSHSASSRAFSGQAFIPFSGLARGSKKDWGLVEEGLGPYGTVVFFGAGMWLSTFC